MGLKLNTASSGSVSLEPANTASNYTLTVPAQTSTLATLTTPSFATTIGVGGATPASSGAGITFPATQSASTDENTLDDYEEGTFTPTIIGTTTAGTGTYTLQIGRYTKVGNSVRFLISVIWTAHTGTGNLQVAGLPFTSSNLNILAPTALSIAASTLTFSNSLIAYVVNNNTLVAISSMASNSTQTAVTMDTAATIWLSGVYQVD